MKTLDQGTSRGALESMKLAGNQLKQHGGGGDLVMYGRKAGLLDDEARRGFARAVGQANQHQTYMPDTVSIILGDGTLLTLPDR
mgnify:FL=1